MGTLPGRLGSLTAHDIMTRDVIVLRADDELHGAIHQLKSHHITGAPVVDGQGKLVGILSINDLVEDEDDNPSTKPRPLPTGDTHADWSRVDQAHPPGCESGKECVDSKMSRHVASVTDHAPLVDVARLMCDGHWHRVPVVDERGKLIGIISTMDVLAAIVNAVDETP